MKSAVLGIIFLFSSTRTSFLKNLKSTGDLKHGKDNFAKVIGELKLISRLQIFISETKAPGIL